jgi:hypothetical protein
MEITLNLSDKVIESANNLAYATQRDVPTFITDTLETLLPVLENMEDSNLYPPVFRLSDKEVITLADSKMDEVNNRRLGELQSKGKTVGLTETERNELVTLLQIYQLGQLRKSEAMAEAVERGLRESNQPPKSTLIKTFPTKL